MKSTKTMVALLVASTLGLGGVAIAATQDHEGGDSRRQAATERTGEDRQRRSERREATDSEGRSERRRPTTAGNDNRVGDRSERGDRNRSDRQARAGNSGNDHGLGRREPQHARADQRTDRRHSNNGRYTGHDRRSPTRHADRPHDRARSDYRSDRRHGNNGRYTGHDRRSLTRHADRSHDRARYAGHDRRKDSSYGIGGRGGFDNRLDRQLSKQQAQIRHGRHSGELSRGEHKRLQKDQSRIAHMDRHFGSDGRYTKVERRKLSNAVDRASNRVYRAKNNDRVTSRSGGHKRNW
ncbi:MAG: hypothetical protein WBM63_02490 [Sedimenticolaceae bacterium]